MTKDEAIRILYEMLSKTANGGGELGGLAVQMAVEALRKQEEPVSEDLEEAVNAYIGYPPEVDECSSVYGKRQAFKAGAKWQKQQLLKDAIDATVCGDAGGYPYVNRTIELYDYDNDIPLAKVGDKVKLIIIKED